MTLADGPRERTPSFRNPNQPEQTALLQLIATTSPRRLPPPGLGREAEAWRRVLAKCEDWNLPPLMTIERLTQANVRGIEPDW
jgi:hypothetical protein